MRRSSHLSLFTFYDWSLASVTLEIRNEKAVWFHCRSVMRSQFFISIARFGWSSRWQIPFIFVRLHSMMSFNQRRMTFSFCFYLFRDTFFLVIHCLPRHFPTIFVHKKKFFLCVVGKLKLKLCDIDAFVVEWEKRRTNIRKILVSTFIYQSNLIVHGRCTKRISHLRWEK